jgi:hypothetical protein
MSFPSHCTNWWHHGWNCLKIHTLVFTKFKGPEPRLNSSEHEWQFEFSNFFYKCAYRIQIAPLQISNPVLLSIISALLKLKSWVNSYTTSVSDYFLKAVTHGCRNELTQLFSELTQLFRELTQLFRELTQFFGELTQLLRELTQLFSFKSDEVLPSVMNERDPRYSTVTVQWANILGTLAYKMCQWFS